MDNVERKLQAKVQRQINMEKQRNERKYRRNTKRLENGTKKIYYTILKEVIRNKKEEIALIDFVEFMDGDNFIPFILCIFINDKKINIGKTYLDFNKLKSLLQYYGFNIEYREKMMYKISYVENSGLHFIKERINNGKYITGYRTQIVAERSIVCDSLLKIDPNQIIIKPNINSEKSKTYTKH